MVLAAQCVATVFILAVIGLGGYIAYLKFDELEYVLKASEFVEICKLLEAECPNTTTIIKKDSTDTLWIAFHRDGNHTCKQNFVIHQDINTFSQMMEIYTGAPECEDGVAYSMEMAHKCGSPVWKTVSNFSITIPGDNARKRILAAYMMCNNNVKVYVINEPIMVAKFAE